MHEASKQYLDGKLCLPPLDDAHPRRVLELGYVQFNFGLRNVLVVSFVSFVARCGTGAW
jgi:hypothetical protein